MGHGGLLLVQRSALPHNEQSNLFVWGEQVTGGDCLRIFIGCVCVFLSMQTLANKVNDSLTTPVFSNGVELFGCMWCVLYHLCGFETSFH